VVVREGGREWLTVMLVGSFSRGMDGTPRSGVEGPGVKGTSERIASSMRPIRCSTDRAWVLVVSALYP